MGCGASSTAAVDVLTPQQQQQQQQQQRQDGIVTRPQAGAVSGTGPASGKEGEAKQVNGGSPSNTSDPTSNVDDPVLSNSLGDENPNVAALRKELLQGMNEMDKVTHAHSFPFDFPAEKVWAKVSDWNLVYLKAMDIKYTVTVDHHPSDPKILTRKFTVHEPINDTFDDALLYISHEDRVIHYVTIDGPLPYHRHFMTFKVIPRGPNACKLVWYSFAYAKSADKLKEAKEMLETGSVSAVHLIQQSLQLTN